MQMTWAAGLVWLMTLLSVPPQNLPAPGVPLTLAEDRASRVSNLRYELRFNIPESQTERVSGRVTVRFDLRDA